jgi:hypothetical protein
LIDINIEFLFVVTVYFRGLLLGNSFDFPRSFFGLIALVDKVIYLVDVVVAYFDQIVVCFKDFLSSAL